MKGINPLYTLCIHECMDIADILLITLHYVCEASIKLHKEEQIVKAERNELFLCGGHVYLLQMIRIMSVQ